MDFQRQSSEDSDDNSTIGVETKPLVDHERYELPLRPVRDRDIRLLLLSNIISLVICFVLAVFLVRRPFRDPSLGVYSPANGVVRWIKEYKFRPALFEKSPYMGFPDDEIDQRWQDLYSFGISKISEQESRKLTHPTMAIPGTNEYLIELDVFHELHCLNDLRKLLFPERFPGMAEVTDENGVIHRDNDAFRHWDHCIDSLRETIMCHADVAPIPFRINFPANKVIVPRISTTHTCRDFSKVQGWAKAHQAGAWNWNVTAEEAVQLMAESGYDHAPWEDIQDQYKAFPGHTYFKYWRDHPEEAEAARKKAKTAHAHTI